jgi:Protein of unknown function (DUF1353)
VADDSRVGSVPEGPPPVASRAPLAPNPTDTWLPPGAEVDLKEVGAPTWQDWELLKDIPYQGKVEQFVAPVGMRTDFASVPRVFVWFLPRYGRYTKAAIIHDYLWRERAAKGTLSYVDADGIFRRALRQLEVPFLHRWILWAAVRWAALVKKNGARGWWKEGWRVVLISVMTLPIIVPPAIVIIAALIVFFVIELIVWVGLQLYGFVRKVILRRPPAKRTTFPEVTWNM